MAHAFARLHARYAALSFCTGAAGFALCAAGGRNPGASAAVACTFGLYVWAIGARLLRHLARIGKLSPYASGVAMHTAIACGLGVCGGYSVGGAVMLAWYAVECVVLFGVYPMDAAVTLTGLREGDAVELGDGATWTVMLSIGGCGGSGMLAKTSAQPGRFTMIQEDYGLYGASALVCARAERRPPVADTLAMMRTIAACPAWTRPCFIDRDALDAAAFRLQRPVRLVQRAWRRAAADPGYAVCRKRLLREAAEMTAL
jgi:hypothetical protein